jgi:hypothetical protein
VLKVYLGVEHLRLTKGETHFYRFNNPGDGPSLRLRIGYEVHPRPPVIFFLYCIKTKVGCKILSKKFSKFGVLSPQSSSQIEKFGGRNPNMKYFVLFLAAFVSISGHAWTVMVISSNPKAEWVDVKGEKHNLKIGQFLNYGDSIITGAGTKVKMIENYSVMVIGENTTLKIEEPEKKDGPPSPLTLNLIAGKARFKVDKTEAAKYRYRIPSIVAGVRGTEFVLTAATEKEVLCVLEGEVGAEIIKSGAKAVVKKNIGWIREGDQEGKLLPTTTEQRESWVKATSL